MLEENKRKYHKLLMLFTNGSTCTKLRLLRLYDENDIYKAIDLGLIYESHKDDTNTPVYNITELGRKIRDE